MDIEQVKAEIKSAGFETLRAENPEYLELVVTKQHIAAVTEKLAALFGGPAWPSATKLTPEMEALVKGSGGLMSGQSFYYAAVEGGAVFVMLWPWSDKDHTTVKAGKK